MGGGARGGGGERVGGILSEVSGLVGSLGGTLAGEHGDGRLRAPLAAAVWRVEARAAFANIKHAGDPAGVFNAGCKIAHAGDEAVGALRHDPEASPLDPQAREALDRIERRRAWQTYRLATAPPAEG